MKTAVIGSGGREHAICAMLVKGKPNHTVICIPGNAGIESMAECLDLNTVDDIVETFQSRGIELVIIGPEQPLVDGLSDTLRVAGFPVVGPTRIAAQIEGSKHFAKKMCADNQIPTAAYAHFTGVSAAEKYLNQCRFPCVIKADGLAAGKGVVIAADLNDAQEAIRDCFDGKFGEAGQEIIIEEFLEGEELSFFVLVDENNYIFLGAAQDHKRAYEGDTGPNTGGMGTYSPTPVLTDSLHQQIIKDIVEPSIAGMRAQGTPYHGILFIGLMITAEGPKVIEYNCRFGDPEAQVILPQLQGDVGALLMAAATNRLSEVKTPGLSKEHAMCVVMATNGYPGAYEKGSIIRNLDKAGEQEGVAIFHAGTKRQDGNICANGGRVLGVTATGPSLEEAQSRAYKAVDMIDWPEGFCRRDIGWRALKSLSKAS